MIQSFRSSINNPKKHVQVNSYQVSEIKIDFAKYFNVRIVV